MKNHIKKVSKNNNAKQSKSETVIIKLTKRSTSEEPQSDTHDNIRSMAKMLKERLSKASKRLVDTPKEEQKTLSSSDWPAKKPSSLRNLQLLKQYLTFVSGETSDISLQDQSIQLTLSSQTKPIEPTENEQSARLGATLIESLVHDPAAFELHPGRQQDESRHTSRLDRRRPGRPPKTRLLLLDDDRAEHQRMRVKRKSILQHRPQLKKKKEFIRCICDTPSEEFGPMVQCDDCSRWLHLECLELNDDALDETFRCPSCFLSLGSSSNEKNAKLLSSITWRYAAQWKSQRLAAAQNDNATDDEEEDEPMEKLSPTTPPPLHIEDDDGYSTDLPGPETPIDWPDVASESRFSTSQDSEVTTPSEQLEPFFKEDDAEMELDPGSLEILSRLAYLQSLDSVKKELFAPNAADVFLCENFANSADEYMHLLTHQVPRFAPNTPPSSICSQDLSEFSFDSGPFWESLL
ncbi:uncharacterized protein B0P05DRAFT_573071 [Gilbertella persicaria]|uniref:uncharacterized protein n=1 Tax=Gilbertella persicaria TaxID=101096 RepID=UPI00221F8F14|nr:uncharacterized protein B0P05DRAFT_573071 [Gilbertella persicaria]KAI8072137.1 hypothetical protein B0P05DRAFT_573071 [Gilbertella persicaria]